MNHVSDLSNLKKGKVTRGMQYCMLKDFTRISGDYVFRLHRTDRVKQFFFHKLLYGLENEGKSHCVGCGRCITECMAGIDITEEAKKVIFPKTCSGDWFLGIATTESGGGTDVVGGKTTIKKDGDSFVVNGEKMYISGVREAANNGGGHVTIAHQSPELGSRGMTVFYLPLTAEGITPTYIDDLGREGISCGGFSIENVKIPKHYIIGEENRGFNIIH